MTLIELIWTVTPALVRAPNLQFFLNYINKEEGKRSN